MKNIVIFAISLSLFACGGGEQEEPDSGDVIFPHTTFSRDCAYSTPHGVCVVLHKDIPDLEPWQLDWIDSVWVNAQACMGITAPNVTVEFVPDKLLAEIGRMGVMWANHGGYIHVRYGDIRKYNPWTLETNMLTWRHEIIHYLLWYAQGYVTTASYNHSDPSFLRCSPRNYDRAISVPTWDVIH